MVRGRYVDMPVNLDNLRAITGGDAALESELFRSFLTSAEECLAGLRTASAENNEAAWKAQAHALKGVCFNVGAGPLAELCKAAQNDYRALPEEKQKMLQAIESEWLRVEQVIKELI